MVLVQNVLYLFGGLYPALFRDCRIVCFIFLYVDSNSCAFLHSLPLPKGLADHSCTVSLGLSRWDIVVVTWEQMALLTFSF